MTEPVENTPDETPSKRKGGKKPYTITHAARAYEHALAQLRKVSKGDDRVSRAEASLRKAQERYDAAVAAAEQNKLAVADAQTTVDEAKAKLDEVQQAAVSE